ncbi:MAG: rhodanese-like domain-containing protein [Thermoanaerobaculia bacterium]
MAKTPPPKPQSTARGFAAGLLVAALIVAIGLAVVWFVRRGQPQQTEPGPMATATPPAAPAPSPTVQLPPPLPPEPSEAEMESVQRIPPPELQQKLADGTAIAIDTRDVQSYEEGHIPGALQIPLGFVQGEVPWFPKDKLIVTYCT